MILDSGHQHIPSKMMTRRSSTMTKHFCIFLTVVQLIAAESTDYTVVSKFEIKGPSHLQRENGYDHREALFGFPPYGYAIEEKVYYMKSTMCDDDMDYSRRGFPERAKNSDGEMEAMVPPFILMIDRGECSFVQKAHNAQRTGASAVLIADDKCLCSVGNECAPSLPGEGCEPDEPVMNSNEMNFKVIVPSFLLFKHEVDPIKQALMNNEEVVAKMSWPVPPTPQTAASTDSAGNGNGIVQYELWTTPKQDDTNILFQDFRVIVKALGDRASFSPRDYLFDGKRAGCIFNGENQCDNLCTNNGRYCLSDPDDGMDKGFSGADVVTESLRRACVWQEYKEENGGHKWWAYVDEFRYRCNNEDYFTNELCIKDAMKSSGVDYDRVNACMEASGGVEGDVENSLLNMELAEQEEENVMMIIPGALVNKSWLRGKLTADQLFQAICAGFGSGSKPEVCKTCDLCLNVRECVEEKKCTKQWDLLPLTAINDDDNNSRGNAREGKRKSRSSTFMILSVLFVGAVGGFGYFFMKKKGRQSPSSALYRNMTMVQDQAEYTMFQENASNADFPQSTSAAAAPAAEGGAPNVELPGMMAMNEAPTRPFLSG